MVPKKADVLISLAIVFLFFASVGYGADESLIQNLSDSVRGGAKISLHSGTGKVRFLAAPVSFSFPHASLLEPDATPEQAARQFLGIYGRLFGLSDPNTELVLHKGREALGERQVTKFEQVYRGLPVIGGELVVQMDRQKNVRSVNGELSPDIDVDITPLISAESAESQALARVSMKYGVPESSLEALSAELSIYNPVLLGDRMNKNFLVWKIVVRAYDDPIKEYVFIDAKSGIGLLSFNQIHALLNRSIYDNDNDRFAGLPGSGPVRVEGGPASAVDEVNYAYDYLGDTYNFYSTFHGRDSIDAVGMQLIATVRYCDLNLPGKYCPYKNAFWNGEQMVFGDNFAGADDVVGHELTHGVTERESRLFYYMQSGAINESLSDIWGEFIDQWNGRGNDAPSVRWLMGEDLPKSIGVVRSMKNPPAKGDPDSMLSPYYYCSWKDGGGVHTNSGVSNKTAYLLTDGGTFGGYTINSIGMDKVAKIYYEVQTNFLTSGSDYQDLADGLYQGCLNLIGTDGITSANCDEVLKTLDAVHMFDLPTKCKNIDVPLCSQGGPTDIFFDDMEIVSGNWAQGANIGVPEWYYISDYVASGEYSIWEYNSPYYSDTYAATASNIPLPSGNIYLQFNHAYEFANGRICYGTSCSPWYPDGGVLEYSVHNGPWTDAESLIVVNGYDRKLNPISYYPNPLGKIRAFAGMSHGYISTKLDLSDFPGQNIRFRFRIGTCGLGVPFLGWFIDDFRIYTCATPYPATVSLASPNGGETLNTGEWADITWQAPSNTAYVNLSYSLDNGVTWKAIVKSFSGSEFQWFVPNLKTTKTKCRVKVTAFDSKGAKIASDKSDLPFTIQALP
jgi:bacillolysin